MLEAHLVALLVELRVAEGAIDKQVGEDQENERDDAGAKESGPVHIVGDVEWVQSKVIAIGWFSILSFNLLLLMIIPKHSAVLQLKLKINQKAFPEICDVEADFLSYNMSCVGNICDDKFCLEEFRNID